MGSALSRSGKITNNGKEALKGSIEEKKGINDVTKARLSTGENTNLGTKDSAQANKPTRSDQRHKLLAEGVVLIHSVEERCFAKQLQRDLAKQGVPCRESLPVGEDILEAANTYRITVFLLSKKFLLTELLMKRLSAFMKARAENPNLQILPLFFMIPPEALKSGPNNETCNELEKCKDDWHDELKAIRKFKGLKFSEGDDEVKFRNKIVKKIRHMLPTPSTRYPVPCIEGEVRICQEVTYFVDNIQPGKREIRIAGLYGIAGQGKTTLGKAFCNLKWGDFDGKVCHLEFSRGDSFERTKLALQYLTNFSQSQLRKLTNQDQAQTKLSERLKGQRVLLVLDNVTKESIEEVRDYVLADMGRNSCILLIARSKDILIKHFGDLQSCMRVPSFEQDEAIGILLENTPLKESTLVAKDREFACEIVQRARTLHPLVLKALGSQLFCKYGSDLSKWVSEKDGLVDGCGYGLDDVFALLGKDFDKLHSKYQTIFMLLTVYRRPNMSLDKDIEWLAINCNEEIDYIEKAVENLCDNGFIETFKDKICIDDIYDAFAQSKAKEMKRWLWWKGEPRSSRGLISKDSAGFKLVKLEQCIYRNPSQISPRDLENLVVLQLVGVQNMREVDLGGMDSLRSIIIQDCKDLTALHGMENSRYLAWLEIRRVNPMLKVPELGSLSGLQHIEIDIGDSQVPNRLGDLTRCFNLRYVNVHCPSLLEFPKLNGLPYLNVVEFLLCDKVKVPLDCTDCMELQSIVLDVRCQKVASPLLAGCRVAVSWREANENISSSVT